MNTCLEGWTTVEYKKFKPLDDILDSESESESEEPDVIRGYKNEKYKKIVSVEELLPE